MFKTNKRVENDQLLPGSKPEVNLLPLLLGNDINVYSLARAFHERYRIRSTVWGKYRSGPCRHSEIIDLYADEQNGVPERFIRNLQGFAEKHRDKKILLIGCGDNYVRLCSHYLERYPENVIAPYPERGLVDTLFHKERFYRLCEQQGIPYPKTFIYRRNMGPGFALPFPFPCILKPANPIMYWQCSFPEQKKVYRPESKEELLTALNRIYAAGYSDSMIIQDFIPGDDTYMRVMTGYANREGRVQLMALGHVLLEEHTPTGRGNHAVIINEYNRELTYTLKKFLETINYTGFFNFDLKYDQRSNTLKVLELNVRQGRSNYYVTGAGYNLAEYVVNDYLFHKPAAFTIAREEYLWSVVPNRVMFKYIRPEAYRSKMKELINENKVNNPLSYGADKNFKRRLALLKSRWRHIYNYYRYLGGSTLPNNQSSSTPGLPLTPGKKG